MDKRQLQLGDWYLTADDGLWTLTSCKIIKASQVQNFVSVPGRFSPLNLSTALTDGEPYYGNATLEAVLESSEGTRAERQAKILELTNFFDGRETKIVHPDWPNHYLVGTVQVTTEYNDLVHARVKLTAVCEPWFYMAQERTTTLNVKEGEEEDHMLYNMGKLGVVPEVKVTGEIAITNGSGTKTSALSTGTYKLPWLYLPGAGPDMNGEFDGSTLLLTGSGTVTFTYREAVLAE